MDDDFPRIPFGLDMDSFPAGLVVDCVSPMIVLVFR